MIDKRKIIELIKNKKNVKLNKEVSKNLGGLISSIIEEYKKKNKSYPLSIPKDKKIKWLDIILIFKKDFEKEINDLFIYNFIYDLYSYINNYKKNNNKYPNSINDFDEEISKTLKKLKINDKNLLLIMTDYIIKELKENTNNVKMRKMIKEEVIKNEELFRSFILMNLNKKQNYPDFQEKWNKIKKIIEKVEDEFLWKMEKGLYSDKSFSVANKYKKFIQTIFPLYFNIWVKKKILTKDEMEKYIKEMNKKYY